MPTYAKTKIADYTNPTVAWGHMRHCAARDASGKIWVIYTDTTKRYVYCKTSTDNGSTWSAAELVHDYGAAEANAYNVGIMVGQQDDRPAMWTMRNNAGNAQLYYKRRGASSWPAGFESSNAVNQGFEVDGFLFQDSAGIYWTFFTGTSGGDTRVAAVPSASANSLASWTAGYVKTFVASGTGFRAWQQNSFACQMDRSGNVHVICGDQNPSASGHYAIIYCKFTTSGSPAWGSVEVVVDTGVATNIRKPVLIFIDVDDNDVPHCVGSYYDTGSIYSTYWFSRSGGSWSAPQLVATHDASNHHIFSMGTYTGGTLNTAAYSQGSALGYGTNTTKENPQYFTRASGSWVRTAVQDISTDNAIRVGGYDAVKKYMRSSAGLWALGINSNGVANELFCWVSSDQVWGAEVSTYNKTCLSTWIFASLLAVQGFVIRVITALTTTAVFGGRQTIMGPDGTLWHAYKDGSSLKCAYSTDQGVTWTITDVGPTFALSSIAMCIGSGDNPVISVSRTSNFDFYFYQWNGSSWVFKKRIGVSTDDTESMQIVYDGTTYHLVTGSLATSTNDRRVRYRSSTDLVTWAAVVDVKNGDGSGTGPQKYRRVAACMGPSSVLHMAYSVRSTGEHRLYYRTRTSGTFGTAVELHVGGSGNNVSDFQSGLSIAVDSAGKAHIVARVRNTAYTSRTKLRYYRVNGTTVEVDEDIHDEVDGDQGMPSISLNGSNPIVCWASAGLGLSVARARRDGAGNWTLDTITTDTRSNVHTVHGPSYGTTYGYGRGVAGTMKGSEEWFQSSDAQAGTGASLENTWSFSGILSTQQRVMSNVWQFVSELVGVRSLTLRNTWIFHESRLNTERPASMANVWVFQSVLGGTTATEWIQQTWHFNSALAAVKTPIKEINQTWQFESRLHLTKTASMADTWTFEGELATNIHRQKAVANTWQFVSTLGLNFTLKKLFAQTWNFISSLIAMKGDEGCEPDFTPERPLQVSEDDVLHVYFIGPLPSPTLAVQLKRPEYGNVRRQSLQVRVNRTRAGGLKVHARTPTYEPQTMLFEGNTLLKMEQVRDFLRVTKGRKVYYIDEQNRKWEGYVLTSDVDLGVEARDKGGTFQLDFEGRLV